MGRAHAPRSLSGLFALLATAAACDGGAAVGDAATSRVTITAGAGIGEVSLGMTYAELEARLGPLTSPSQQARVVVGRYPDLGLEVVLTSPSELEVAADAVVIAAGVRAAPGVEVAGTPRPGQARATIEAALGPAPEAIGDLHYYEAGASVEYDEAGVARAVGVFAPFTLAPTPAE
jgi:hypothetical protein